MALKLQSAAFSLAYSALFDWRFTMKPLFIFAVLTLNN